jgi:hypothetical protein
MIIFNNVSKDVALQDLVRTNTMLSSGKVKGLWFFHCESCLKEHNEFRSEVHILHVSSLTNNKNQEQRRPTTNLLERLSVLEPKMGWTRNMEVLLLTNLFDSHLKDISKNSSYQVLSKRTTATLLVSNLLLWLT